MGKHHETSNVYIRGWISFHFERVRKLEINFYSFKLLYNM